MKTNIGFLENVISHPTFYNGECTVKFIDEHPDLFKITQKFDRGTKTLRFLADVSVNGHPDVKVKEENKTFRHPVVPDYDKYGTYPKGTKNILTELGPEKFAEWLRKEKAIHYTDTTFRDAHQSLLATRMRGINMMKVAEGYAKNNPEIFLWKFGAEPLLMFACAFYMKIHGSV